jgi:hypothetical protein
MARERVKHEKAVEDDLASLKQASELLDEYPTMFAGTLEQARLMARLFDTWAWMGDVELDLLNRTSGPEAIKLAREINRIGKELK